MKVSISRKGFDSSAGRAASPICKRDDSTKYLVSLPIPLPDSSTCSYRDVNAEAGNLYELICGLLKRKSSRVGDLKLGVHDAPHLDPDLTYDTMRTRAEGWRPCFGQSEAFETQLRNAGFLNPESGTSLEERPLFLFFGWYREAARDAQGEWTYLRGSSDLHALWGWLQVEHKYALDTEEDRARVLDEHPWASYHPHLKAGAYSNQPNALYLAPRPESSTDSLALPELGVFDGAGGRKKIPAAGIFRRFDSARHILTVPGEKRSRWRVPEWMMNSHPILGMHDSPARWTRPANFSLEHYKLQTVGRGQEFVFDTTHATDQRRASEWIRDIIIAGTA